MVEPDPGRAEMRNPITEAEWQVIRRVFQDGYATSTHFALATVSEDGGPGVTPIGSLVLGEPGRGFWIESYAVGLQHDLARNPRVCVMAVNTSRWGGCGRWSWCGRSGPSACGSAGRPASAGGDSAGGRPLPPACPTVPLPPGTPAAVGEGPHRARRALRGHRAGADPAARRSGATARTAPVHCVRNCSQSGRWGPERGS
jgi:hypothetical protein